MLNFVLNLINRVSGPAGTINRVLGQMNRALGGIRAASQRAWAALGTLRSMVFNLPNLFAAGAAGFSGKLVLDAVRFKQDTLTAFSTMAGSRQEGERLFNEAFRFAAETPFSTKQVVDGYQKLLAFQFKPVEIPIVMRAVGDLATLKGFDQTTIDRLTLALGQIRAKGRLQGEEMMQLAESGVGQGLVYDIIAKKIGKTRDEVMKLQQAGQISSDLGIYGVLKAIEQTASGGQLGNLMKESSRNISGLWGQLQSRPMDLFIGLDESQGIKSLTTFMDVLNQALDTAGESGGRLKFALQSVFGDIFEAIFGPIASDADPAKRMRDIIDQIAVGIIKFSVWWKQTIPIVVTQGKAFGSGLMQVFGVLSAAWQFVQPIFLAIGNALGSLFGQQDDTGSAHIIGMAVGIAGSFRMLNTVTGGLFSTMMGWLGQLTIGVAKFIFWLLKLGVTWLIGLGPVGWVILAVIAIGGALVLAYNKIGWFRDGVDAAWEWIKQTGSGLLAWFQELPARFASFGSAMIQGLINGVYAMGGSLRGLVTWVYDRVVGSLKSMLGIRSPSRVFAWMGSMLPAGMAQGMASGESGVARAATALGAAATVAIAAPAMAMPTVPDLPALTAGGIELALPPVPELNGPAAATGTAPMVAAPTAAPLAGRGVSGAPTVHVTVTVQVQGGGSNAAAQVAAATPELKGAITEGVLEAIERLAYEGGFGG